MLLSSRPAAQRCPVRTFLPHSIAEADAAAGERQEIRAYKLGKKRWSYNQVELSLAEAGGSRATAVRQAVFAPSAEFPESSQESAVCFDVQLTNGHNLQAHLYIVYDRQHDCSSLQRQQHQQQQGGLHPRGQGGSRPRALPAAQPVSGSARAEADGEAADDGDAPSSEGSEGGDTSSSSSTDGFEWDMVLRRDCCRGCQGCILRPIQRFGRLGKRSWSDGGKEEEGEGAAGAGPESPAPSFNSCAGMKHPKFMYVSIDEACTHVDAPAFRLLAAVYDGAGSKLLATTVSPPIRVLANNDVPTGAARIPLEAQLPADWEGWAGPPQGQEGPAPQRPKRARPYRKRPYYSGAAEQPARSGMHSGATASELCAATTAGTAGTATQHVPTACSPASVAALASGGVCNGSLELERRLAQQRESSLRTEQHERSVRSRSTHSLSETWAAQQQLQQQQAAVAAAAAALPDAGTCVRSFAVPAPAAGVSPLMPLSQWQAVPGQMASAAAAAGAGAATAGAVATPFNGSAGGAPRSFSAVAEHDGHASVAAAAAGWSLQQVSSGAAAAAGQARSQQSPRAVSLPTELCASTTALAQVSDARLMLPSADHLAAWQQQQEQAQQQQVQAQQQQQQQQQQQTLLMRLRQQRLAAVHAALRDQLAAQHQHELQQLQMQQHQQLVAAHQQLSAEQQPQRQPPPQWGQQYGAAQQQQLSPTGSDASAVLPDLPGRAGCPSPPAKRWASLAAQQQQQQQQQQPMQRDGSGVLPAGGMRAQPSPSPGGAPAVPDGVPGWRGMTTAGSPRQQLLGFPANGMQLAAPAAAAAPEKPAPTAWEVAVQAPAPPLALASAAAAQQAQPPQPLSHHQQQQQENERQAALLRYSEAQLAAASRAAASRAVLYGTALELLPPEQAQQAQQQLAGTVKLEQQQQQQHGLAQAPHPTGPVLSPALFDDPRCIFEDLPGLSFAPYL